MWCCGSPVLKAAPNSATLSVMAESVGMQVLFHDVSTKLPLGNARQAASLADLLADTLDQHALQRGARRVVVVNVPDVTVTPRFLGTLQFIAAQGPTGPATAAAVKGLAGAWVKAFNDRIHARLGKKPQVVIVDFNRLLTQWVTTPAAFGLTNVTTPACPGPIATCTTASLNAFYGNESWRSYVFSDNFHGTPKTNELVADAVLDAVMAKGPRGWK